MDFALEKHIDHTLLRPTATISEIKELCEEAIEHKFVAVCLYSSYLPFAKDVLKGTGIRVATVVGFPSGAYATHVKLEEARYCVSKGADELDMVINLGWFKSGDHDKVREEIKRIKEICGSRLLKVILETCYLSGSEIRKAAELAREANADFIKTSTGFGTGGATPEAVRIMLDVAGDRMQVKASGGIRDVKTAVGYLEMGVTRLGTSSGVELMRQYKNQRS